MACVKTCSFCGKRAINSDHEECILKFGTEFQSNLIHWYENHPEEILPESLKFRLKSSEYKAFKKLCEQKIREVEKIAKLKIMEQAIESTVLSILDSPESKERLQRVVSEFGGDMIFPRLIVKVHVIEDHEIGCSTQSTGNIGRN